MRLSITSVAGLALAIAPSGPVPAASRDLSALPVVEVSAGQYPPELAAKRLEGTVIVVLDIAPSGELRCTVPPGGDTPELARPSCTLIAQRDVFPPDLDRNGRAIPTHMRVGVRWTLQRSAHDFGGAIPLSPDR